MHCPYVWDDMFVLVINSNLLCIHSKCSTLKFNSLLAVSIPNDHSIVMTGR